MILPKVAYIYGLYDPRNHNQIVYVGKTNNHYSRLGYYKKDAYKCTTPVYKWVRSLLEAGIEPCLKVLEKCKFMNWRSRERRLISIWRKLNSSLLNVLNGGNGSDVKGIKEFCDKCGTKRVKLFINDGFRCPVCRPAERKIYERSWNARTRKQKIQNGICVHNGCTNKLESKTRCKIHLIRHREYMRNFNKSI